MHPFAAQLRMAYADAADLACAGAQSAETVAQVGCALGFAAVVFAWEYRARAALEDDHRTWAAIAFLVSVAHVLAAMWAVPIGCLSGHLLTTFVGYASPWLIAALLFRIAIAPTPAPFTDTKNERPGDPFA
jgi:uncharacterized membrane protein